MPKTNDTAPDAFIAVKTEIDVMLARLSAFSADHFEYGPEDVNWAHVGTLGHYRTRLREISDMAFPRRRARRVILTPPRLPPRPVAQRRW